VKSAVRVITTCTSRKVPPIADRRSSPLRVFDQGDQCLAAEDLYAGEQHRRLMAGVHEQRAHRAVEVWVISAGVGLVQGDEKICAYDETFAGASQRQIRDRADVLDIPSSLRRLVAEPCARTFVVAGNHYFDAARLDQSVAWGSPTLALVSHSRALRMPAHPRLQTIAVGQADARQWSLPLTLLKGEIVRRMLVTIAQANESGPSVEAGVDIRSYGQVPQPFCC
jgi:hypothetical protein